MQSWDGEARRQGRPWVLAVAGGDSCEAISGVLFSLLSVSSSLRVPRFNPDAAQLSSSSPSFRGCCLFVIYVDIVYLLFLCVQGKIDSLQLRAGLVPRILDLYQENITQVLSFNLFDCDLCVVTAGHSSLLFLPVWCVSRQWLLPSVRSSGLQWF